MCVKVFLNVRHMSLTLCLVECRIGNCRCENCKIYCTQAHVYANNALIFDSFFLFVVIESVVSTLHHVDQLMYVCKLLCVNNACLNTLCFIVSRTSSGAQTAFVQSPTNVAVQHGEIANAAIFQLSQASSD